MGGKSWCWAKAKANVIFLLGFLKVFFHWGYPPLTFFPHWGRLPLSLASIKVVCLSSIEVVFHWGCLPLRSSSIEVVFHWGRLPLRSSSIEDVFNLGCLSKNKDFGQEWNKSKLFQIDWNARTYFATTINSTFCNIIFGETVVEE